MKLLLITLLSSSLVLSSSCDNALNACQVLTKAQDKQIIDLKMDKKQLETKLSQTDSILPSWVWLSIGVLVGGTVVMELRK